MKKGIKLTAAAALAVSAITPVAAFAAETTLAPGYYSSDEFMSVKDFAAKKTSEKKAFFKENFGKSNFIFVDASGKVYDFLGANGEKILNATDTELPKYSTTLAAYQTSKGVTVSESGIAKTTPDQKGELEVVSVSAINSTTVEIKLNQKVQSVSAANIYLGITQSSVADNNLEKLAGGFNAGRYDVDLVNGDTIRISGASIYDVIWEDLYTYAVLEGGQVALALALSDTQNLQDLQNVQKNKTTYVQLRNLRGTNGKLLSTVETSFDAKDTNAPQLLTTKYNTEEQKVVLTFDEPVYIEKAKFYVDDKVVANDNVFYAEDLINDAYKTNVVEIYLETPLEIGEYDVDAVGILDLAGNAIKGNIHSDVVKVVKDTNPSVTPEVLDIVQTDDGKFDVLFNTTIASAKVSIKNLYTNVNFDAEITDELGDKGRAVYKLKADGSHETDENGDKIVVGYNYEVEFANKAEDENDGIDEFAKVYNTSTSIKRTIDVTDIVSTGGKNGEDESFTKTFTLDQSAPTAVLSSADKNGNVKADDLTLTVVFPDAPWGNNVVLGKAQNGYDIVVKIKTADGETKSVIINTADVVFEDNSITLDLSSETELLNEAGDKLIVGDLTVQLPRGIVTDDDVPTEQYKGPFQYIGGTLSATVVDENKGESAPQTAQNLVTYDDVENAIYVYFIGEDIDVASATTPANYKIAGNTLTSKSKFEFSTIKDITAVEKEGITPPDGDEKAGALVKIFLEEDTIAKAGQYTLEVKNVATKTSGAKMQLATLQVAGLLDNTSPLISGVKVTGDAQIEVTFNESIVEEVGSERNFIVTANGRKYTVDSVAIKENEEKVLVIHTKESFGLDTSNVSITLDVDQNDDMFVLDTSNNKAKKQTKAAK